MTETTVEPRPLGDILARSTPAPAPVETPATTGDSQPAIPPADGQDGPPPSEKVEPPTVPRAALESERAKRQDLERRLQESERRSPPPEPDDDAPDPLVDPKGYSKHIEYKANVARFEDRFALTTDLYVEKVGQDVFEAAEKAVMDRARRDPAFAQQIGQEIANARNPAKVVFERGKALQEEAPDPQDMSVEDRIVEKLLSKLSAQGGAPAQAATQQPAIKKPAIPESLADVRSARPGSEPSWGGPKPLSEILKRK